MSTRIPRYAISVAVGTALLAFALLPLIPSARQNLAFASQATTATSTDDAALLDGYRHVEVASVSDAMEKITGKRAYMSHHMRPIFPAKFAGFAVTVLLKKEENQDPNALGGMLAAIDQGTANAVYVEATAGVFNSATDLAIAVDTTAPGGLHASDFVF